MEFVCDVLHVVFVIYTVCFVHTYSTKLGQSTSSTLQVCQCLWSWKVGGGGGVRAKAMSVLSASLSVNLSFKYN